MVSATSMKEIWEEIPIRYIFKKKLKNQRRHPNIEKVVINSEFFFPFLRLCTTMNEINLKKKITTNSLLRNILLEIEQQFNV